MRFQSRALNALGRRRLFSPPLRTLPNLCFIFASCRKHSLSSSLLSYLLHHTRA